MLSSYILAVLPLPPPGHVMDLQQLLEAVVEVAQGEVAPVVVVHVVAEANDEAVVVQIPLRSPTSA